MKFQIEIPDGYSFDLFTKNDGSGFRCAVTIGGKDSGTTGYECRYGSGTSPQEAIDQAVQSIDLNSGYWKKLGLPTALREVA